MSHPSTKGLCSSELHLALTAAGPSGAAGRRNAGRIGDCPTRDSRPDRVLRSLSQAKAKRNPSCRDPYISLRDKTTACTLALIAPVIYEKYPLNDLSDQRLRTHSLITLRFHACFREPSEVARSRRHIVSVVRMPQTGKLTIVKFGSNFKVFLDSSMARWYSPKVVVARQARLDNHRERIEILCLSHLRHTFLEPSRRH